jgi:hypothetical protein
VSREQFAQWVEEDAFLEYAEFVGNSYGTPKKFIDKAMEQGRDVILDIEIQGAEQVHQKRPDAVRIFIAPPSWDELERRLIGRGTEDMDKVRSRLQRGKDEFFGHGSAADQFHDDIAFIDDLLGIGGQNSFRNGDSAVGFDIQIGDFMQNRTYSGTFGNAIAVQQQIFCDSGTDSTESDNTDFILFHSSNPFFANCGIQAENYTFK